MLLIAPTSITSGGVAKRDHTIPVIITMTVEVDCM